MSLVLAALTCCAHVEPAERGTEESSTGGFGDPNFTGPESIERRLQVEAGELAFRWAGDWPRLPLGMELGNTHGGIAFGPDGRGYVTSDVHGVIVVDASGEVLNLWGGPLAGGAHGLCYQEHPDGDRLWVAHTARHSVAQLDPQGRILQTFGCPLEAVDAEGAPIYADAGGYRPTGVAVDDAGHVWVADGYGASWVHEFDGQGTYLGSIGGPGAADGQFRTCHGITFEPEGQGGPALLVADRENGRLQRFDLQGRHLETLEGHLRRPCGSARYGDLVAVPDLAGRVTLLGADGELVGHLGENRDPSKWANHGVPSAEWEEGQFTSPHGLAWDAAGDLYVMDWVAEGRITRLARTEPFER